MVWVDFLLFFRPVERSIIIPFGMGNSWKKEEISNLRKSKFKLMRIRYFLHFFLWEDRIFDVCLFFGLLYKERLITDHVIGARVLCKNIHKEKTMGPSCSRVPGTSSLELYIISFVQSGVVT